MPTFLLPFFERHFCVAHIFITSHRTAIHISGPFSYSRELALPSGIPITSPCSVTTITRHVLPKPLIPIAPTIFPANQKVVSLAA